MSSYLVISDGGSRGNPGPAASAFVVFQNSKQSFMAGFYWGERTNNQAEYLALIMALEWLKGEDLSSRDEVTLRSDSELMIKQLTGKYKVKSPQIRILFEKSRQLLQDLSQRGISFRLEHKLRQHTYLADSLLNKILDLVPENRE